MATTLRHRALFALAILLCSVVACHCAPPSRAEVMDDVELLASQAVSLRQRKKFDEARDLYERALDMAPNHARLHFELGNMLLQTGDLRGAVSALRDAVHEQPHIPEPRVSLGVALMQVHQFSEAAKQLKEALALPNLRAQRKIVAHELLATARLELGSYKGAVREFKKLLRSLPSPDANGTYAGPPGTAEQARRGLMGLGRCYVGLQRYHKALELFNSACAVRGGFDCHDAAGAALSSLQQPEAAKAQYSKALFFSTKSLAKQFGPDAPSLEPQVRPPAVLTAEDGAAATTDDAAVVRQMSGSPQPRVYVSDEFLSSVEAEEVRQLFDSRHSHPHTKPPLVCFSRGSVYAGRAEKLQRKAEDLIQKREDESWIGGLTPQEEAELEAHAPVRFVDEGGDKQRVCFDTTQVGKKELLQGPRRLSWSTSTFVYPGESPLLDTVQERLESVFGLPRSHALATQLLKYKAGESYGVHTDCNLSLRPNQRAVTALVYLTDVAQGGHTEFPFLNVSVAPKVGRVVVFTSLGSDRYCDYLSSHIGAKVDSGLKYVIQQWYLSTPVPGGHHNRPGDKMAPHLLPGQPYVLCDRSKACREYFPYDASRTAHLNRGGSDGLIAPTRDSDDAPARPVRKRRRRRRYRRSDAEL